MITITHNGCLHLGADGETVGGSAGGNRDQSDGHQFLFVTLLIRSISYIQLADPCLHAAQTQYLSITVNYKLQHCCDVPVLCCYFRLLPLNTSWDSCTSDLITPLCALISLDPSRPLWNYIHFVYIG